VAESLDQKYDFEPATGKKIYGLNMILLHLKIQIQSLNPQKGLHYVLNLINCCTLTVKH
jgi:hypothetical protein